MAPVQPYLFLSLRTESETFLTLLLPLTSYCGARPLACQVPGIVCVTTHAGLAISSFLCFAVIRFLLRREEKGTGARGAPVPVVGHGLKIKRAELRSLGSRPDEAHVNSR